MSTQARILVAEDEPDTLRGLERMLGKEGYRVDGAKGGLEAAEKLKAEHFDVIVSDLRMPIVDGMDLLRMAKQKDRDVVFIVVTAYGTAENAVEAIKLGASGYIAKPFAPSTLTEAVEKGIEEKAHESTPPRTVAGKPSQTYRFHREHAWACMQPDGTVIVGADQDFFDEAGEIVFCDLPLQGDKVVKGQRCARTINTTGLIQRPFHCPLSGTVVEVNDKMEHEPWEARRDPYGEGWLFRIAPSKLGEEM